MEQMARVDDQRVTRIGPRQSASEHDPCRQVRFQILEAVNGKIQATGE